MGGRGSFSGAGGMGGGYYDQIKGIAVMGSAGEYKAQAAQVIKGAKAVLEDFGIKNGIERIEFIDEKDGESAGQQIADFKKGTSRININNDYLGTNGKVEGAVAKDFYTAGAHEAGHAVVTKIIRDSMPNASNLKIAEKRKSGAVERSIIKEAAKRYGSNPKISRYGERKASEKVAEAVADVYGNKGKANPYSKVIVGVLKDIKSGKFKSRSLRGN